MEVKLEIISKSEKDTKKIAGDIVERFIKGKRRCVVFLKGELGSGKTTFVRFALEKMGIDEKDFQGSPTFTIVNEYGKIYHIDLYRMESVEDVYESGVYDYLNRDGVFFIEWPEVLDIKPDITIEFITLSEKERQIDVYIG